MSQRLLRRGRNRSRSVVKGPVVIEDFYVVKTGFGKEEICREYDVKPPYIVCVTFDGRVVTVRDPNVKTVVVTQD
ncbi:MAG: hypothetical protein LM589_06915 [Thermosphaera sp.]|nr:hypothetical protein [Thermosphaera sp.]MCC6055024.1 hypothetical protein [Thermosphaera sp.]